MGCSLAPPLSVSLNFLALPLSLVRDSDDTSCPSWLPLTVSICPLLFQKDPVTWEMNVKTPDLLANGCFFPQLYLRVLRGQKRIDFNISQSSAALTGLYTGPTVGAFLQLSSASICKLI